MKETAMKQISSQPENVFELFSMANTHLAKDFLSPSINSGFRESILQHPNQWMGLYVSYFQKQMEIWVRTLGGTGEGERPREPVVAPDKGDRRFSDAAWRENPAFDFLKQSYLLASNWLAEAVKLAELSEADRKKLNFHAQQYIDSICPANFAATNPEAWKQAADTKGVSLAAGLKNLLEDMEKRRISMTDESAFEVGRNLAVTPGSVVFENDLIQLIQYAPTTETVCERPLLIVPPCINKYYILDLQPENSFVHYAVGRGLTVFLISWRNASAAIGHTTWRDYQQSGIHKAIAVVQEISGAEKINTLGFCIGGAMLSYALAVLVGRKQKLASSMTLLTTMLDYSEVGDIGVYVYDPDLLEREKEFQQGRLLYGKELSTAFSSLRPNDLIWNYVVNNYLKGKSPPAFDLLYWNSDSTNLPGPLFAYYLRNLYLENNMAKPGCLTMDGVAVDLGKINIPSYLYASREDHIAPWSSCFASTELLKGKIEFVLGASGHIAGVINPPSKPKRNFWTGGETGKGPEHWLKSAQSVPGSWWLHWSEWLKQHSGKQVVAPAMPGNKDYPVIEPAPGRYVKERAVAE
jgi:polyhydroxyalkanoate synthase